VTVLNFVRTPQIGLEAAISKLADRPVPGDRGIWMKSKCLKPRRVRGLGWIDPEGSRSHRRGTARLLHRRRPIERTDLAKEAAVTMRCLHLFKAAST
jgi:hypothetical protein